MKYLNKTFHVSYGSKRYREGWERMFRPEMKSQVICLFWDESPWSDKEKAWSLHISGADAARFKQTYKEIVYDSFGDTISVERSELVMTTKEIYNKLCLKNGKKQEGGMFVEETDFVSTQMELFK